jgi:hypothetical protein
MAHRCYLLFYPFETKVSPNDVLMREHLSGHSVLKV